MDTEEIIQNELDSDRQNQEICGMLKRRFPLAGTLPNRPGSAQYWPISTVKAHYWLGVAYELQGKKQDGIKEYETFLRI